jgi:hypothetical protein
MRRMRVTLVVLCLAGLLALGCGGGPSSGPPGAPGSGKPPSTPAKQIKPPPDDRG